MKKTALITIQNMVLKQLIISLKFNKNKIMKNTIYIFFWVLFCFNCTAQTSIFKNKKLIYDANISIFQNINIPSKEKFKYFKIESELNLHKLENLKIKSDKFDYDFRFIFLPEVFNDSFSKFGEALIYGSKTLCKNNLYLYREIYTNNNDKINEIQFYKVGLLLIENSGYTKSWIKVFESDIDSERSLRSYLFNNYIVIIKSFDSSYDVAIAGREKKMLYKYVIFLIEEDGNVILLNNKESEKIKRKWLLQLNR